MMGIVRRSDRFALIVAAGLVLSYPSMGVGQPAPVPTEPGETVAAFDALFDGPHSGAHAVHAKGIVVRGRFIPGAEAPSVSRAVHFTGGPVPVVVRFSNFASVPGMPDGAGEASPRGMAIRFFLPDGSDTDIVAHSYDGFPAATPVEFLAFLRAVASPPALAALAAEKPAVQAFLADPKPAPASFATERFFGVNAFRFTNVQGVSRFARYRILPLAGERHLPKAEAAAARSDYLARDLAQRLAHGFVGFRLVAQLAENDDPVTDGSVPWPESRPMVELGTFALDDMPFDQSAAQKTLKFQPINLVDGIAPSKDPMLLFRTQAYRVSGERRAPESFAAVTEKE